MIRELNLKMHKMVPTFDPASLADDADNIRARMLRISAPVGDAPDNYNAEGRKYVPLLDPAHPFYVDAFPYLRDAVLPWFKGHLRTARVTVYKAVDDAIAVSDPVLDPEMVQFVLPLTHPEGVVYHVDGTDFTPEPGQLWYLDRYKTHSVTNPTTDTRLTLIVECPTSAFVARVFSNAGVPVTL